MDRRTFIKAAEGMERLTGTVLGRHGPDSVAPSTLAKKKSPILIESCFPILDG